MSTYPTLRAANLARQAEWTGGAEVDILWRGNELGGEVGEALNVVKKLARERRGWPGSRATVQELADELADVIICADLLAMTEGIDLEAAVARKFNATSEKVGLSTRLADPARAALEQLQPNTFEVGKSAPYFCLACQAVPRAGYCNLPGCPTARATLEQTDG